jgi:hypothetical protein
VQKENFMPPNLSRYLNKTLFVSIPALFEDGTVRPCTLLGAEINGLWLQSEELTDRLLRDEGRELSKLSPAVFVPFAQIAGVLIATTMPVSPADECTKKTPSPSSPKRVKKR